MRREVGAFSIRVERAQRGRSVDNEGDRILDAYAARLECVQKGQSVRCDFEAGEGRSVRTEVKILKAHSPPFWHDSIVVNEFFVKNPTPLPSTYPHFSVS